MTEGRLITRYVPIDIAPTIDELAKMIAHMNNEEHATLISSIAKYAAGFSVPNQLSYVVYCEKITTQGLELMRQIGDSVPSQWVLQVPEQEVSHD